MSNCKTDPFEIKRGASFHALIQIPTFYADGYFVGWTLKSQARTDKDVLLAELDVTWDNPITTRVLVLKCLDTTTWAIGAAGVDVFLKSPDGYALPTSTAPFYVVQGRTHA